MIPPTPEQVQAYATANRLSYRTAYKRVRVEGLRASAVAATTIDDVKVVLVGLMDLI